MLSQLRTPITTQLVESTDAQFNLGVCYGRGGGVSKDVEQAVGWWRKAAGLGHAKAQQALFDLVGLKVQVLKAQG